MNYTHLQLIDIRPEEYFECIIHGKPVAQKRPGIRLRYTRFGVPYPQIYNQNENDRAFFRHVLRPIVQQYHNPPLFFAQQPLHIEIGFFMPRPQNHFRTRARCVIREESELKPNFVFRPHIQAPDTDNMVKFILDAFNEILYADDRQIVSIYAYKVYDNEDECTGRTYVRIKPSYRRRLPYNYSSFE